MKDYAALAEYLIEGKHWPFRIGDKFGPPAVLPEGVKPAVSGAMMTDAQFLEELKYTPWNPTSALSRFMLKLMQARGKNGNFKKLMNQYDFYKSSDVKNHVMKLMNDLGIKSSPLEPLDDTWDGKTLYIGRMSPNLILHEVCHWQVASQLHRFTPEYGLGVFSSDSGQAKKFHTAPDIDETLACVLSSCWLASWGISPVGDMIALNIFNTPDPSEEVWESCFLTLTGSGLIDENFNPRLVARLNERKR